MTWRIPRKKLKTNDQSIVSHLAGRQPSLARCVSTLITLTGLAVGCAAGSVKTDKVASEVTDQLPGDLAPEIKAKFDLHEAPPDPTAVSGINPPSTQRGRHPAQNPPLNDTPVSSPGNSASGVRTPNSSDPSSSGVTRSGSATASVIPAAPTTSKSPKSSTKYPYRRPSKDPFAIGEVLTYSVSYFGVKGGELSVTVLPNKEMSGRKVHHIQGHATSSAVFSMIYRINDYVETYMDHDGAYSHRFHLLLDESKQRRDSLELNDSENGLTHYLDKWQPKDRPYQEIRKTSPIAPFSQDTLSALYYLRMVPLPLGGVVRFPVVSEGKTWEAICNIVRREVISSPLGKVPALVIQPDAQFDGILKKNGDSFLWISDDERRIPLRLEAKVKIGTVVVSLKKVQ